MVGAASLLKRRRKDVVVSAPLAVTAREEARKALP
jgi:hypothetical protein